MLRKTLKISFIAAILYSNALHADTLAQRAAVRFSSELGSADSVSVYFLSRTENYDFGKEDFKEESTVRIFRKCGSNCSSFMKLFVDHLRGSRSVKCGSGQQNILLGFGKGGAVYYSYSGRVIEFHGECYVNSRSLNDSLRKAGFPFG